MKISYFEKEFFKFFLEQFKQKSNGDYRCVMIYPLRGEAYAIKKAPKEMIPNKDIAFVYELSKKENNFFNKHKELCNVWLDIKKGEVYGYES